MDPAQTANIKRIRQACANCRRRKTKCSGERPTCFHCRRNNHRCVYEPYSATISDNTSETLHHLPSSNDNSVDILHRVKVIESRLAELSGIRGLQQSTITASNAASLNGQSPYSSFPSAASPLDKEDFLEIPPLPVLHHIIDKYFECVHNRPYSHFQEAFFRQRLENNLLPRCLILAILAIAVRFSTHQYYEGRTFEASESYAKASWLSVLADHLTVEDNMNLHIVQTANLLAVVDATAGRVNLVWMKIGLAARISQGLHLMEEPDRWLSYTEQEERRRTFWSTYLLDKLVSCGRSRPLVILDEDCGLQLPCDESTFRDGRWRYTGSLGQLLSWNAEPSQVPSAFALVILTASIFGHCTRYVYLNSKDTDKIPPWDIKSGFSAIKSSLLLVESYSKVGRRPISEIICGDPQLGESVDQQEIGQLVFAHALFHLCHCLLNHPLVVRLRLKPFSSRVPHGFFSQFLQAGYDHAKQLIDLIQDADRSGCRTESSFYAYCIAVAGGIHSLASQPKHEAEGRWLPEALLYFQRCVDMLGKLGKFQIHAANMAARLCEFHAQAHRFIMLLNPACLTENLDPFAEETLWSMLDYGTLWVDPMKKPASPGLALSNLPLTPTSWALNANPLTALSSRLNEQDIDLFSGLTSSIPIEEVDGFMDGSSRDHATL